MKWSSKVLALRCEALVHEQDISVFMSLPTLILLACSRFVQRKQRLEGQQWVVLKNQVLPVYLPQTWREESHFVPFLNTSHIVLQFLLLILLPFPFKNFTSSLWKRVSSLFFFKCALISDKIWWNYYCNNASWAWPSTLTSRQLTSHWEMNPQWEMKLPGMNKNQVTWSKLLIMGFNT